MLSARAPIFRARTGGSGRCALFARPALVRGNCFRKAPRVLWGLTSILAKGAFGKKSDFFPKFAGSQGGPHETEKSRVFSKIGARENRRKSRKFAAIHQEKTLHEARVVGGSRREWCNFAWEDTLFAAKCLRKPATPLEKGVAATAISRHAIASGSFGTELWKVTLVRFLCHVSIQAYDDPAKLADTASPLPPKSTTQRRTRRSGSR